MHPSTDTVSPPLVGARTARRSDSLQPLALPLVFIVALAALGFVPPISDDANFRWSLWGAAALLAAWAAGLYVSAARAGRQLAVQTSVRAQHWLQACAHASIFAYWGWYWPTVYDEALPRIISQLVFAYAFDMLLVWSQRDDYTLGFGQFPIIFSTNLFLWFKPGWFHLQLLMIAVGFAGKDLIRWQKDGRRTHIFNPSSLTLSVFSLGLIATGTTNITWGQEIAITQFFPPHMYLFLFLIGLPGQFLFGVTTMTMSAVLTTYLFGVAYFAATGTYYFYDSYIPIAVFLGMHLLFTDPSTAPRTELGRLIFGATYGLTAVLLYKVLTDMGVPSFYDKLLQVPLMNLSIQAIDRAVRSPALRWLDPGRLAQGLVGRPRNAAYISVWATAFVAMYMVGGVGDTHRGQYLPFWQQACANGSQRGCAYLANVEAIYCNAGSAWACNEWGILEDRFNLAGVGRGQDPMAAFGEGCELGLDAACQNRGKLSAGDRSFVRTAPTPDDYPIVLRGTKAPIDHLSPEQLKARACEQGWPGTCTQ
ncbi:MAG: hypothetical protein AB7O32_09265 [Vicinamibacterales bacterium]